MSEELLKELEGAAGPDVEQLTTIANLMALQIVREGAVAKLEAELKEAKTSLNDIRDKQLPDIMKNAKCKLYVDDEGRKLELKDEMTISLPKKRLDEIIKKMREWGFEDLVSNVLTCTLEKGQDNMAGAIMGEAEKLGLSMTRTENIAAGSVKKVIKDKRKDGEDVDLTFFGAFEVMRAKITQ